MDCNRTIDPILRCSCERETCEADEPTERQGCAHCGTTLGIDCGDAEPDFDERHCSEGCYWEAQREVM